MNILVNGDDREISDQSSIQNCIQTFELKSSGIAIAVNNEVVPKTNWDTFILKENDKLLIIRATSGG